MVTHRYIVEIYGRSRFVSIYIKTCLPLKKKNQTCLNRCIQVGHVHVHQGKCNLIFHTVRMNARAPRLQDTQQIKSKTVEHPHYIKYSSMKPGESKARRIKYAPASLGIRQIKKSQTTSHQIQVMSTNITCVLTLQRSFCYVKHTNLSIPPGYTLTGIEGYSQNKNRYRRDTCSIRLENHELSFSKPIRPSKRKAASTDAILVGSTVRRKHTACHISGVMDDCKLPYYKQ